jgi:outer membrane protein
MSSRRFDRALKLTLGIALATMVRIACAQVDLLSSWDGAEQKDPAFAAARADMQAGQARGRQGRALFLPTVTVSGSVGYGNGQQNMSGAQFTAPGFGTVSGVEFRTDIHDGTATGWRVTAQQPIYNAELRASARQLELQSDMAELQFRAAHQDLMLRTARIYFEVLLAEDALEETRRQAAATSRALKVAKETFDEGKSPITDRNEAQARYDDIVAQEALAHDDLELKRAAFFDLTGLPADRLKRIPPNAALRPFDAGKLDQWITKTGDESPLIGAKALARDIAVQEVRKFDALTSPTLALVAQAGGDRLSGNGAFGTSSIVSSNSGVIGLQLSVPIFTGGLRSAKSEEALALADRAQFDTEATRSAVIQQTRGAWLGATSGLARIRAREQALASATARLDATEIGHEVGARTTLDLLNAQADFFRAQRALQQVKYQVLLDRLTLAKAAGELSVVDLQSANANLTPAAN